MSSHPQYADAAPYVGKFRALQQRAMGSMRSRVQSVLRMAIEQVWRAAWGILDSACPLGSHNECVCYPAV